MTSDESPRPAFDQKLPWELKAKLTLESAEAMRQLRLSLQNFESSMRSADSELCVHARDFPGAERRVTAAFYSQELIGAVREGIRMKIGALSIQLDELGKKLAAEILSAK